MDVNQALDFVEKLLYEQTGKHLNDLEREVFLGSWHGQTYEKIYPLNPQYIEKDVSYKLWKKLSNLLGEKVAKKNLQGAIDRAFRQHSGGGFNSSNFATLVPGDRVESTIHQALASPSDTINIFISHQLREPDLGLAHIFHNAIIAAGHNPFMAGESTPRSQAGLVQINAALDQCDYFLLLLSPQTATSEMVIEELQRARELQEKQQSHRPILLPIRVNYPMQVSLNHDLQNYLDGIHQREWKSATDTVDLVHDVLQTIQQRRRWDDADVLVAPLAESLPLEETIAPSCPLPPQPVADPELPSGQVRLASAFYIERVPYETQCYKELLQPGALIRIKAPRQMGKTSLMARILYQARELGYRTVPLSFQHADTAVFANLNQLLRWFCTKISRKLKLPDRVDDHWSEIYGSKDNCTEYFINCLLQEGENPLVLGLDEVDRVFQYPHVADDFFGLLRAWYEEAGYGSGDSDRWQTLRLVVVHSTEVYVPLDVNQSPFNVGLPIELSEFSPEQVQDLTDRHGLQWGKSEVSQLMTLIGGHPYLVRLALYHIAQHQMTLDRLLQVGPTEAGIYDDHLRRHRWNLQQHPNLESAFAQVVVSDKPVELESMQAFKLHSMGLVKMQGNQVMPRFDLYRQYFRGCLKRYESLSEPPPYPPILGGSEVKVP